MGPILPGHGWEVRPDATGPVRESARRPSWLSAVRALPRERALGGRSWRDSTLARPRLQRPVAAHQCDAAITSAAIRCPDHTCPPLENAHGYFTQGHRALGRRP